MYPVARSLQNAGPRHTWQNLVSLVPRETRMFHQLDNHPSLYRQGTPPLRGRQKHSFPFFLSQLGYDVLSVLLL